MKRPSLSVKTNVSVVVRERVREREREGGADLLISAKRET